MLKRVEIETTRYGRTYPLDVLVNQINSQKTYGMIGPREGVALSTDDVAYVVSNAAVEHGKLFADVLAIASLAGSAFQKMVLQDAVYFAPTGTGNVDDNGVVSDYTLASVDAFLKEARVGSMEEAFASRVAEAVPGRFEVPAERVSQLPDDPPTFADETTTPSFSGAGGLSGGAGATAGWSDSSPATDSNPPSNEGTDSSLSCTNDSSPDSN